MKLGGININFAEQQRDFLVSFLKLTGNGSVRKDIILSNARIPAKNAKEMLRKLSAEGFIRLKENIMETLPNQRVKIAIYAIKLGADFERVCRVLKWSEFENIAAETFKANNFFVKKCLRFKWAGRRWEIDLLGFKEHLIACVDCKHWRRGWQKSAIIKSVKLQVKRTKVLTKAFPFIYEKIGLVCCKHVTLVPVVLSLVPGPIKFCNNVPIVPVIQLQDFLNKLPTHVTLLTHFLSQTQI